MECPSCNERMGGVYRGEHTSHACIFCNGIWLSGTELGRILAKEHNTPSMIQIAELGISSRQCSENRFCPTCTDLPLRIIKVADVELDLCRDCNGIFFDENEIKQVLPNLANADTIDVLDNAIVKEGLFWIIVGLFS